MVAISPAGREQLARAQEAETRNEVHAVRQDRVATGPTAALQAQAAQVSQRQAQEQAANEWSERGEQGQHAGHRQPAQGPGPRRLRARDAAMAVPGISSSGAYVPTQRLLAERAAAAAQSRADRLAGESEQARNEARRLDQQAQRLDQASDQAWARRCRPARMPAVRPARTPWGARRRSSSISRSVARAAARVRGFRPRPEAAPFQS